MRLNDETFGFLRGQILGTDPLAPLDKIFNIVHPEEHHKGVIQRRAEKVDSALAFAVSMKTNQSNSEKPTYKHCGRTRHDEASCYELLGYPPGWSTPGRGRGGHGNRGSPGGRTSVGRGRGGGRESAYAGYAAEHLHRRNTTDSHTWTPIRTGSTAHEFIRDSNRWIREAIR